MKTAMQQLKEDIEALKYHYGDEMKNAILTRIQLMFLPIERQQLEDAWSESRSECFVAHEAYGITYIEQGYDFNHYFKTTYNE